MMSTTETNPDINKDNITKSPVIGIFPYQHKGYFRDVFILQIVSKVVSNCWTERIVFASFS